MDGLKEGNYAFAGEESAGATFIEKSGLCWTTDKDGFVMTLLAAEIVAETGKDPYQNLSRVGRSTRSSCLWS